MLPAYRLVVLARRLVGGHPVPPRPVDAREVVAIFAPFFLFSMLVLAILIAVAVVAGMRGVPLAAFVVAPAAFAAVIGIVAMSVRRALETGVYATAEVIAATATGTRLRATIDGQEMELTLRRRQIRKSRRLDVIADPGARRVLLVLGVATT